MFEILWQCDAAIVKEVLQRFIDGGGDINRVYNSFGTLLHAVIANSGLEVVQFVLGLGASRSQRNNEGLTPLEWALHLKQQAGYRDDRGVPLWLAQQGPEKQGLPRYSQLDDIIQLLGRKPVVKKQRPQWK